MAHGSAHPHLPAATIDSRGRHRPRSSASGDSEGLKDDDEAGGEAPRAATSTALRPCSNSEPAERRDGDGDAGQEDSAWSDDGGREAL